MTMSHLVAPVLILMLSGTPEGPALPDLSDSPRHVTVTITSQGYDPSTVVVRHGDVVRFVQADGVAHNVEFHRAPAEAQLAPEYPLPTGDAQVLRPADRTARVGPFLIGAGRAYEIRIGAEMPEGVYQFGCSRHSGWRGTLVIEEAEETP